MTDIVLVRDVRLSEPTPQDTWITSPFEIRWARNIAVR